MSRKNPTAAEIKSAQALLATAGVSQAGVGAQVGQETYTDVDDNLAQVNRSRNVDESINKSDVDVGLHERLRHGAGTMDRFMDGMLASAMAQHQTVVASLNNSLAALFDVSTSARGRLVHNGVTSDKMADLAERYNDVPPQVGWSEVGNADEEE